ncbi:MAG: cysteine--tRNA ligase [Bacillota bacterium]
MAIKFYNTLTRRKENFEPVEPLSVRFYVCGPTVYDFIHIGNARVFIIFDCIRRYLQHRGFNVTLVQNYTDIDDKMIQRAQEQGSTVGALAEEYITAYRADAALLRIRPADIQPRATEHISQIIALIESLVEKGMAYSSQGDVYFNTAAQDNYGLLSQQKQEELLAGARVDPGEKKNNPLDFTLWKQKKTGEPAWDSPWGEGRPGWHIECSAMAMHYLGETIDIHAGGADLVFPHHENEIAQSSGATGKPFARYWLHAGFLNIEDRKMSKSLGNVLTVNHLLQEHRPLDLRFFILSAHYRSPLNYSQKLLHQARAGRERLQETVDNLNSVLAVAGTAAGRHVNRLQEALETAASRFTKALDDDFNTADGISVLFDLARQCNIYLKEGYPYDLTLLERVLEFYRGANEVLEILDLNQPGALACNIEEAIERRKQARQQKDWSTADRIRDELLAKGIVLEDTPHGTRWKRK